MQYIRLNLLRIGEKEFVERLACDCNIKKVKWCNYAFEISCESPGSLLEYQLGYFYVQSLSSMVPVRVLNPRPSDSLLDLAAAPGSKTTQAAMHMNNEGMIIANDASYMRLKSLGSHLDRLGIVNTAITNYDGRKFPSAMKFTKVLLDAPCSSIGSRKGAIKYSKNRIHSLARLQKSLIIKAFDLVEEGGELVYSTCTTTVDENENVIKHLLEKRDSASLQQIKLPFGSENGICDDDSINEKVARFELDESFFICKIGRG